MAAYASVLDIVNAGEINESARMGEEAHAGDTVLSTTGPVDLPPGALLVVGYLGQASEAVNVLSSADSSITLSSALKMDHPAGTRLLDATPYFDIAEAASRMVDDITWTPAGGWAYSDQAKETQQTKVDHNGDLVIVLGHTPVKEIYAVSVQSLPFGDLYNVAPERVWWDDGSYIIHVFTGWDVPIQPFSQVKVTVTYAGGYTDQEMPKDIRRCTAMIAMRLWKEKDSGYSDIIGSNDLGTFIYSKAVPPDVKAMLIRHRRVGMM
jgi:hypothetical protein